MAALENTRTAQREVAKPQTGDSVAGALIQDFHNAMTEVAFNSPAMKTAATRAPEPSVEKDPKSGAVTALLFTDNIYNKNARSAADKRFDELVAA